MVRKKQYGKHIGVFVFKFAEENILRIYVAVI